MKNEDKIKEQLFKELSELRQENKELKTAETERKQKEEEFKIRAVFEDAYCAMFIADPETGKILECNTRAEMLIGRTRDEIIRMYQSELHPQDEAEKYKKMFALHVEKGHVADYEGEVQHNDGRRIPVWIGAQTVKIGCKNVIVGNFIDFTKPKKIEERLQEAEERYRAIFDQAANSILLIDAETGELVEFNERAHESLGFTQDEFGKFKISDFDILESANEVAKHIKKIIKEGTDTFETKQRTKGGEIRDRLVTARAISIRGKKFIQSVWWDITEQKRAEEALRESEKFSSSLLGHSPNPIIVINPDTSIRYVNPALEDLTGFSSAELIGKKGPYPWWTEETLQESNRDLAEAMRKGASKLEELFQKKNGERFWVEITSGPVISDGEFKYYLANWVDITDRKKAEEELITTREYLNNIIESSLDGIVVSDSIGYITKVNNSFLRLLGYQEEEIIGKFITEFTVIEEGTHESTTGEWIEIDEGYINDAGSRIYRLYEGGKIADWKGWLIRKDKKIILVEQNIVLLYNKEGDITGSVGIIRDITEKEKAEKEIKETRDFLESIFENSMDGIVITDEKGNILSCNKAFEKMSGFEREELFVEHISIIASKDEEARKHLIKTSAELFEKGSLSYEWILKSKDGRTIDVECNSSLIMDNKENCVAVVNIIRDITERKEAEKTLKGSEERLSNLIEFANVGIIISEDNKITQINKVAEEMYGYSREELIGQSPNILTPEKYRLQHREILNDIAKFGKTMKMFFEEECVRKDGSLFPTEISFSLTKKEENMIIAVVRDITERKEIEKRFLQSEKLKSLGELAGGVAHDFNNVLAAILGRAQLLKMNIESPPGIQKKRNSMLELKQGLEVIERAAKDGAETVRRIQEFSRRRDEDKYYILVDLNEIIENALEFTKARWKDDAESKGIKITIQKEFSTLPKTSGSAAELREVFTNLINNALDAMPQGGNITIKTIKEDSHIAIKVEDTGVGIVNYKKDKIFDPFFTTKGVQSTGLGLSVSYGIINRHRGSITVDSIEGERTTFTIKLPISEKVIEEEKVKPISEEQRKAKILVVEDKEDVRSILSDILINSGHEVETASNGSQGIELFKKKEFDLVFTDLGMHGMSGWKVAEKVKRINRRVPVALITGWNVELKESEMKDKGVDLVIHKPFEVNQVLRLVQEGMVLRDRFEAA